MVEAIYEGYLLHYGAARICAPTTPTWPCSPAISCTRSDLARLVALADLDGVRELADVISLSALARALGDAALADDVWRAGARAIAWGADPEHERAKDLAFAGRARSRRGAARRRRRVTAGVAADSVLDIVRVPCRPRKHQCTKRRSSSPSTRSTATSRARSRARPSRAASS